MWGFAHKRGGAGKTSMTSNKPVCDAHEATNEAAINANTKTTTTNFTIDNNMLVCKIVHMYMVYSCMYIYIMRVQCWEKL